MARTVVLSVVLLLGVVSGHFLPPQHSWHHMNSQRPSEEVVSSSDAELLSEDVPVETSTEASGLGASEKDDTDCTGKTDGVYPINSCSTKFLTCSGGIARIMDCPAQLVYNNEFLACDYPMAVAGCSSDGSTSLPPSSSSVQPETSTEADVTSTEEVESTTTSRPTTCSTEDGFFSFGRCSDKFTACTNGRSIEMSCPAQLAFDEQRQLCDYPLAVPECANGASFDEPSTEVAPSSSTEIEASGSESNEASGNGSGYEYGSGEMIGNDVPSSTSSSDYGYGSGNGDEQTGNDAPETTSGYYYGSGNGSEEAVGNDVSESTGSNYGKSSSRSAANDSSEKRCVDGVQSTGRCSASFRQCIDGRLYSFQCDQGKLFSKRTGSCRPLSDLPECAY
ncbi:unnamed protein product [Caenorhabditis auriculariae]|uniref:Chitin-binding type-2 domain-containing protein n=1 Tax=Caenorhabditis auriculariae TaxID=2777116 RepID=A0A8S1GS24_9PELO|nr:unnamed protein product [Caenorhabditis auriculariae]